MRNLEEYPITNEEIVNCLRGMAKECLDEQRVGDMRPLLLEAAAKKIESDSGEVPVAPPVWAGYYKG